MYKFYNANPKKLFIDDCVLRSISVAEGISWKDCHQKLSYLSGKRGRLLNEVFFVEEYLDERYKRQSHCSKLVGEFIEECPRGTYLVTMEGHITVVIDGVLYDTFDCRNRRIWCVWKVMRRE